MKNKILIVSALLLLTLFAFFFLLNDKSVEEIIKNESTLDCKINYQEVIDNGEIVFYEHTNQNDFTASLLKKTLFGYKLIYTGTQGELERTLEKQGLMAMYFPEFKGTTKPLIFGVIGNLAIEKVIVTDQDTSIPLEAKIINKGGLRFWLLNLDSSAVKSVIITGKTMQGEQIIELEELKLP
jgi:hypothetical protein